VHRRPASVHAVAGQEHRLVQRDEEVLVGQGIGDALVAEARVGAHGYPLTRPFTRRDRDAENLRLVPGAGDRAELQVRAVDEEAEVLERGDGRAQGQALVQVRVLARLA
jgi:hypothetical protein